MFPFVPLRLEEGPPAGSDGDAWGDEHEYYNDRPGAIAPLPAFSPAFKAAFAPADDQKVDLSKVHHPRRNRRRSVEFSPRS